MQILEVLVWVGTLTFAATGALTAIEHRFDLIGVFVLAGVTAIGGGSIRDVVVGVLPPTSLLNEALLWAVAGTGLVVFLAHRILARRGDDLPAESRLLYVLDTVGLGIFAALGAQRGLDAGLGMWGTVFAGAVSGVGGGILRDVLTGKVPGILYRSGDLYATAAAVGAAVVFWFDGVTTEGALIAGAVCAAMLRVGSRGLGLRLPVPRVG